MFINVGTWNTLTKREKLIMLQIEVDYNYLRMLPVKK